MKYRENLPKGNWKSVQVIEVSNYRDSSYGKEIKSFLRKFHSDFKFVRITEIRIRESAAGQCYSIDFI